MDLKPDESVDCINILKQKLEMFRSTLACLLLVASLALTAECTSDGSSPDTVKERPTRIKLFDFELFKSSFNKKYPSLIDELSRCRIFLANAFKVFIRWVMFKNGRSTSYLGINSKSDLTRKEIDRMYNFRPERVVESKDESVVESGLELDAIERKLDEAVERRDEDELFEEIAAEVESAQDGSIDDLAAVAIDQLDEQEEQANEKLARFVESNNPHYEQPELLSMGAESEEEQPPLDAPVEVEQPSFGVFGLAYNVGSWVYSTIRGALVDDNPLGKEDLPDEVFADLRQTKCITRVKDQSLCGSCYIFSTIALLEFEHCTRTGKLVEFSEQFPLDCGYRSGLDGCEGGHESQVIKFTKEHGLELGSNYPYSKTKEQCPYSDSTDSSKMGYLKVNEIDQKYVSLSGNNLELLLETDPVLIGVFVAEDFTQYAGGVHLGASVCDRERGHAMLLVGHGREDGMQYWLFKNSHGEDWGERGYYKLNKKTGYKCLIGWSGLMLDYDVDLKPQLNYDYHQRPVLQRKLDKRRQNAAGSRANVQGRSRRNKKPQRRA